MRTKLIALLMCIVWVLVPISVAAAPIDMDAFGSVTVTISYQGEAIGGGTLSLIRVADIEWKEDAYSFLLSEEFQNADLPLTALDTREVAEQYAKHAETKEIKLITAPIDENGVVVFENLPVGLYLITRHECPIKQVSIAPFMVTVPLQINGESVYDVDASPKVSLVFVPSEGDHPEEPDTPGGDKPEEPEFPDTTTSTTPTTVGTTTTTPDTPKIPQTGQLKWPIPLMASVGMVLLALGWRLVRGKDRVSE